ncbi:uncharacterized protein LOC135350856 isoform X3 [Halichondria panicea]|uniref:uncharacterized protein LOC135350856 isoform X3 n=1 Tax=Halichondria panicea TaxID=6063 RepID=UPI00312B4779
METKNAQNVKLGQIEILQADSKRIFDNAMEAGKVKVRNTNVLIVGMAGAGKTATKHLIFGVPPPDVRNSTPLAEAPIQAQVRDVSGIRAHQTGSQWTTIDANDLEKVVGDAVAAIGHQLVDTSSERMSQLRQSVQDIIHRWNVFSRTRSEQPQATGTPAGSDVDAVRSELICSHSVEQSDISEYIVSLDSKLVEMIRKRPASVNPPSVEASKVLGKNWIYFIDSGGQPHFHNILPHFIQGLSIVLFTHRLCDKLDNYPEIHYVVNDQSIGSFRSTVSVKDTLTHLIHSICSHSNASTGAHKPNMLFIGTFHDKIEESNETLDEKNDQLLHLLPENYREKLILHGKELDQLIFAINAKSPNENDKDKVKFIRETIESSPPFEVDVPIKWFVLEVFLNNFSNHFNRKVIRKSECLNIASQLLKMEEAELNACLQFFHSNHLLHYYPVLPNLVFTSTQVLLDKLTELVRESYQLKGSESVSSARPGVWRDFRDKGIITPIILKTFSSHYVEDLFNPSDLFVLFEYLLIITPLSFTEQDKIDYSQPNAKAFMPCLLGILPANELEKYRLSSEIEPLVLSFPSGILQSGIFCCLQVYLIQNLKWKLVSTDGRPNIIAQNCVMLSHSKMPCTIVLIDSFSYIEAHVQSKISDYRIVCPLIRDDIVNALHEASLALNYTDTEEPVVAFFCPDDHAVQAPDLESTPLSPISSPTTRSIPKRHVANRLEYGDYLRCSLQDDVYPKLTEKHNMWIGPASSNLWVMAGNNPILNVGMHLQNVRTTVHRARLQWKNIGRGLNVPDDDLESIHEEHCKDQDFHAECLYYTLKKWMQSGIARIEDLLDVLEGEIVGHKDLVQEIRQQNEEQKRKIGLI